MESGNQTKIQWLLLCLLGVKRAREKRTPDTRGSQSPAPRLAGPLRPGAGGAGLLCTRGPAASRGLHCHLAAARVPSRRLNLTLSFPVGPRVPSSERSATSSHCPSARKVCGQFPACGDVTVFAHTLSTRGPGAKALGTRHLACWKSQAGRLLLPLPPARAMGMPSHTRHLARSAPAQCFLDLTTAEQRDIFLDLKKWQGENGRAKRLKVHY